MPNLLRLLDQASWQRAHTWILVTLGVGWMLDSFEVNIVGNVLGIVKKLFNLSPIQGSLLVSLWLVGILVGALAFGYLADRFGRKRLIVLTVILYAACTILTAFAWNYDSLMTFRFLTALGVGAEYSVINASIAEFVPARDRGWSGALVINFWSVGAILGSLVTLLFISILPPAIGWRLGFAIGAIGAVAIGLMRRHLPESPRWLLLHGRLAEARAVVKRLTGVHPPASSEADEAAQLPAEGGLWAYRRAMVLGGTLAISLGAGYYGLFAAVPLLIIPKLALPVSYVPVFFLIGNAGSLFGGLLMTYLMDRWGRIRTVGGFFLAAALTTLLLLVGLQMDSALAVEAAFFINCFFMTGAWTSAYPMTAELLPTAHRATGMGLSIATGRLAAAFGPVLLVTLAASASLSTAVWVLAGYWGIGAIALAWWRYAGVEAKARPLEEIGLRLAQGD